MRGGTIVDKETEQFIYEMIGNTKIGTSIQDKFLRLLIDKLLYRKSDSESWQKLELVFESDIYGFKNNFRTLVNSSFPSANVYAYFDYPIMDSDLYLGTFDSSVANQIIYNLSHGSGGYNLTSNYRTTLLDESPITIRVGMEMFASLDELFDKTFRRDTLRYINEGSIVNPKQLFDVVDFDGVDESFTPES